MDGASAWRNGGLRAAVALLLAAFVVSSVLVAEPDAARASDLTSRGLTVNVSGEGIVTYSDGNSACSTPDCKTSESANQLVFLTAVPAQEYTFKGWTKGCAGSGVVCGVTPAQAPVVSADFVRTGEFEVTVSGPGVVIGDGGAISCGLSQSKCTDQLSGVGTTQFTAGSAPGAVFLGWGGECAQFATSSCTVDNGAYGGATATFAPATPPTSAQTLSVTHQGPVVSAPDTLDSCLAETAPCVTSVPGGSAYTLTAGFSFVSSPFTRPPQVGWSGGCVGSWPECSLVVDGPTAINDLGAFALPDATLRPGGVQLIVNVKGRGRLQALRGTLTWPVTHRGGCGSTVAGGQYSCILTESGGAFELRAVGAGHSRFRRWGSNDPTLCRHPSRSTCSSRLTFAGPDLAANFTGG